tara:strand:+ start:816 stop:2042 length:1227 start_codon:yes stop_codon:yes gene_type:complete
MSGKWPGGFITKTAPTVVGPVDGEGGSASGVWTLDQVADYEKQGLWPRPTVPRQIWGFGYNAYGQIGDSTTTNRSSPVQVGALTTWSKIAPQSDGCIAVKSDGTLWSWGRNTNGQLGQGNTTNRSSPVQVGALTTWVQVGGTKFSGYAIKTDGTLWSWGLNSSGELGLNNTTNYSSPVQIGALTDWYKVDGGSAFALAIKTDGTLWGWGKNNLGQLGDGTTTNRSSPVQIGSLTNWSSLAKLQATPGCRAIKTDGTLWAWGENAYGELGLGDSGFSFKRSSPVQVGALTTWLEVAAGPYQTLATQTNGKVYSWGQGTNGKLGQGNTTNYSSPVQIGALTTWLSVAAGYQHSIAAKTDGTLWAIGGLNDNGRLGTNNTTNYSSPVQVGSLTTWLRVAAGYTDSKALKSP